MNKNKFYRVFIALFAVLMLTAGFSLTAYAQGGEETPQPEPTTIPEPTPQPSPVPLTPDGNLTLVDDIQGEQANDKQFVTVVSKSGNYFYLVIDRAGDKQNVYFLNLVDEADLMALIEDKKTAQPVTPIVTPEPEAKPDPEPTPQPQKSNNMGGVLILMLLVAGVGGGAFYYFKVLKPKQGTAGSATLSELDDFDFEDEDETDGIISADAATEPLDGYAGVDTEQDEQE